MSYEHTTTLELMAEVLGRDPRHLSITQAALVDNLLRAHQEQVRRMEEDLRQQVRRILGAPPRPVIVAGPRFRVVGRGRGA